MSFFTEDSLNVAPVISNDVSLDKMNRFFASEFGREFASVESVNNFIDENWKEFKRRYLFRHIDSAEGFINAIGKKSHEGVVYKNEITGFAPSKYYGAVIEAVMEEWNQEKGSWERVDVSNTSALGIKMKFRTSFRSKPEEYGEFEKTYRMLEKRGLIIKPKLESMFISKPIEFLESILEVHYRDGRLDFESCYLRGYEKKEKTNLWNRYCPEEYRIVYRRS